MISTSNHMSGRVIWDKLQECIFENFENFENDEGASSQKSPEPNMWLLAYHTIQQTLCTETDIILTAGNYKTADNYKLTLLTMQC